MTILTKPLANNWFLVNFIIFMSIFSGERFVTFVNPCYEKILKSPNIKKFIVFLNATF